MNKEIEVILIEVIKEEKRITVSRTQAIETKRLRDLKIGSLIRGFIRNVFLMTTGIGILFVL